MLHSFNEQKVLIDNKRGGGEITKRFEVTDVCEIILVSHFILSSQSEPHLHHLRRDPSQLSEVDVLLKFPTQEHCRKINKTVRMCIILQKQGKCVRIKLPITSFTVKKILKRRKESGTYLATDSRHRWRVQMMMKNDK